MIYFLCAITLWLTFLGIKVKNLLLSLASGGFWILTWWYVATNYTLVSPMTTLWFVLCIAMALFMLLWCSFDQDSKKFSLSLTKGENGQRVVNYEGNWRKKSYNERNADDRQAQYRDLVRSKLYQNRKKRR
jgi:uncharacterized membrane protein